MEKISETRFVRSAITDRADLSAFNQQPTPRIIFGLFLMGFSYVIGLPGVAAMGAMAIYLKEPLIGVIGGPVIYGLSHLVFIAGIYFAGTKYVRIFVRWGTRVVMEKLMGTPPPTSTDTDIIKKNPTV